MEYLTEPIDFDINRAFELRKTFEKSKISDSNENNNNNVQPVELSQIEQLDNMVRNLPFMNDNIRTNIKLGIEIYKQLNNFDRYYIHSIINENSIKSN
jgi:hypothetical protein